MNFPWVSKWAPSELTVSSNSPFGGPVTTLVPKPLEHLSDFCTRGKEIVLDHLSSLYITFSECDQNLAQFQGDL